MYLYKAKLFLDPPCIYRAYRKNTTGLGEDRNVCEEYIPEHETWEKTEDASAAFVYGSEMRKICSWVSEIQIKRYIEYLAITNQNHILFHPDILQEILTYEEFGIVQTAEVKSFTYPEGFTIDADKEHYIYITRTVGGSEPIITHYRYVIFTKNDVIVYISLLGKWVKNGGEKEYKKLTLKRDIHKMILEPLREMEKISCPK